MKKQYFVYLLLLLCSQLHAQQPLTKVEYFIDADPGYGFGVDVPFTAGTTLDASFSVSLPGNISEGFHYLTVRVKDSNNQWSYVLTRPFLKESLIPPATSTVVAMEYFIDADPGYGAATAVPVTAGSSIDANFTVALPSSILDGFHYLTVRTKDSNNQWSTVIFRPFLKESLITRTTSTVVAMEYFIDTDPGYGAATAVPVTAGTAVVIPFTAALGSLPVGTHHIYIRVKDDKNQWSVVGVKPFTVANTFSLVTSQTPSTWCKTAPFNVSYQAFGTYASNNVFTAQLSDAAGSFDSPTVLGTLASISSGNITANIPSSISTGTGYRIRVISSSPTIEDNPGVEFNIQDICPPPCATALTLVSTADDYSSGVLIREANGQSGLVVATNKITGSAQVTYLAGKSVTLNPGFLADKGTVFTAQKGGCE